MRSAILFVAVALSLAGADSKKVVFTGSPEVRAEDLQAAVPEVRIVRASGEAIAREIADADAVIGGYARST